MPVFDCREFSREKTDYVLSALDWELNRGGQSIDDYQLFLMNIYFGSDVIRFPGPDSMFHVCRIRDYGALIVAFHQIKPQQLLKKVSAPLREVSHTCATIVWAANELKEELLTDAMNAVDDIARSIELATGRACLIPFSLDSLPRRIEIAKYDRDKGRQESFTIELQKYHTPLLDKDTCVKIAGWEGYDKRTFESDVPKPQMIFQSSAVWQGKAIRALGKGDTEIAVVMCQVWIEMLLVQLACELNELAGVPIRDVKSELQSRGLLRFVNLHLGSRYLKGNWDHTCGDTRYGQWHRDCYILRNEVVHTGKHPSREEAAKALNASNNLSWSITENIANLQDPRFEKLSEFFGQILSQRSAKKDSEGSGDQSRSG